MESKESIELVDKTHLSSDGVANDLLRQNLLDG